MLKKILVFVLLLAIIVSVCVGSATYFLKPFIKQKVLDVLERGLGRRVELSGFDVNLLRGVIFLKGINIEDAKLIKYHNALTVDEIVVDIDLASTVLRKSFVFQKIYIKNFVFSLKNKKRPAPSAEAALQMSEDSKKEAAPLIPRGILAEVYIKRLLLENSKFVFTDYPAAQSPTVIEITNINGRIDDISVPLRKENGILKGTAHLKGQLNLGEESLLKLDGSFAKRGGEVDFDFELDLDNINLAGFSPYYSNTSFTILKEAKLDLYSEANCLRNNIKASQDVRIYDIVLYDIKPAEKDTLFSLPANTVIDFFKNLKGEINFNFDIVGTIDDPKFTPGPVIEQILANAMRDKIIAKLQGLPREVIQMGEKALKEHLEIKDKLDISDEDIDKEIKDIKKELKKIIDYKP